MFKLLTKVFVVFLLITATLNAADIKIITKYGKTGGIVGRLNTTSDMVNGRAICTNNPSAGCDFSNDSGWSDNGTPNDGSDDIYTGDLTIRTNDIFELVAAWSWNGASGEDTVTLKSTLPAGYRWESLPGACDSALSSIDGQSMTCVRKDVDVNNVGTVSEDLTFAVRVLGSTNHGATPGDITIEISGTNATTDSDAAGRSLTVTAAPRWNLQKSIYTMQTGYEKDGVKGYRIYYKYYIEVDEVTGETDTAPGYLGSESMGEDATFTFTDDLSGVSPNASLIECKADTWSNSNDPYPYYNASYPERSVATPQGTQTISCSQSGSSISVNIQHVDARLDHIPTKDRNNRNLPVNRAIAAIGVIEVFVPIQDVKNGLDGIENTSDDGSLPTHNVLTNFDPTSPSGNSNFGSNSESENDNEYNYTLYYAKGGFSKGYALKHGQWVYTEGGSLGYRTGDGLLTANAEFATRLTYSNSGGIDLHGGIMCDVIDANRMTIEEIPSADAIYNGIGGFDIYVNGGFDKNNLEFEYASTYVNDTWLASKSGSLDTTHGADVAQECSATTGWYTTMTEAKSHGLGVITKIRIKVKDSASLQPGQNIYAWIKHKVRAKTLDNIPLENGDELVNYGSIKDDDYYTSWYQPSYIPHAYPTAPTGWAGDRVTYSGGKVRIIKTVDKNSINPGDIISFTLDSSFTNDTGTDESTTVTIKDMLPVGLTYIPSSTEGASEPTIGTCADVSDLGESCTTDNQVLIWNLGTKQANVEIADIIYKTEVDSTAPQGTMTNYAMIEAPSDASAISQRRSDVNLNLTIPATINLSKSVVDNSPQEPNGAPIDYRIDARNGSSVTVTNLDIIDILPFNGDGDSGAIKFRDLALKRTPATAYHGDRSFVSMKLIANPNSPGLCDLSPGIHYYYTTETPTTINLSAKEPVNQNPGTAGSIWCEGDENGPADGCGYDNSAVTAIRASGPDMGEDGVCQLQLKMSVLGNKPDDIYSNSAGANAEGVTLPVLSNAKSTLIVKSSLGNYVWFDTNNNGIQDSGESGLNDINVSLYQANGTLVETTKTANDANGNAGYYHFTNLHSGDYYIVVAKPTGFVISPQNVGDDSLDSDIDVSGKTATISLAADSEDLRYDAGLYKPSSIGDTIWYDTNKNGIQDSGEDCRGMNVEVKLLDSSDTVIKTQTTQNCHYLFTNLNQGSYKVQVTLPTGYEATTKSTGSDSTKDSDIDTQTLTSDLIILANGNDITDVDIGYFSNTSLGDLVWLDTNANGIQDAGENGIDNITVELLDTQNNVINSQTTTNGGKYLFEDLVAGEYKIRFTIPAEYKVSDKDSGTDDSKDSDVSPTTYTTDSITVTQGTEDIKWDLGLYKEVSISDIIWVDDNGNGLQDSGEDCDSLEVKVTLVESNITQTTQNCSYKFDHLKPGSYTLKFTLPNDYTATKKDAGDDSKDSDIDEQGFTGSYTLTSGEQKTDVDAGMLKDASLGDIVWLDADNNGIQDAGEVGLKDITIELLKADGTATGKSTTTDANGHYQFSGLKPAGYKIKVTLPIEYKLSTKDSGTDDSKDSDIDTTSKESDVVTLHSGENYVDLDVGMYSISSLGDIVWVDTNANGIQDEGEKGLENVVVTLLNGDKTATGKSTTTDSAGHYIFENLVAGYYRVKFTLPSGYKLSKKDAGDDSLDSDVDSSLTTDIISLALNSHNETIDMGVYQEASVGDKIWEDSNNNGIQDSGEPAVKGVLVTLLHADGTATGKSVTTGEDGLYKFENLTPDTYQIAVTFPQGYTAAKKNIGRDSATDSDIGMDGIAQVTLRSGDARTDIDAGIVKDGAIGDRVWLDSNKNGIQDEDERGIADVALTLLLADGTETNQTAKTNAEGIYSFTGLKPADYKVKVLLPEGYHVSPKNAGDDSKDSDIDSTTLTTDTITLISGTSDNSIDIGLFTSSELGDRVWLDTNANGIQDAGEEGIENVEVTLLDADENPYSTPVKTDATGLYLFSSLPAGEYRIKMQLPEGYKVSAKDSGDDTKDSDIDSNTLTSHKVTLTTNTKDRTIDMGLYKSATIGDTIWLDANNNGRQDSGESCQGTSFEVTLLDANGAIVQTTQTDNCHYQFTDVKPGSYKVAFKLPKGISIAKPNVGDEAGDSDIDETGTTELFTVISDENKTDIDAGFLQNASIGNLVWLDANTNGIQDEGEKGVEGVSITLLKADGTPAGKTTKTDADGHYSFSDLEPSTYAVMIVPPEGYVLSIKDVGSDDSKDSDADRETFKTQATLLESGENDTSWDIGIYALTKLGDKVWLDRDADGIQDDHEEGISNIKVTLLHKDGTPTGKTTTTNDQGIYQFSSLKPDSYKVAFSIPDGYVLSPKDSTDEHKDSDVNHETNTTDTIIMQSGEDNFNIDLGLIALKNISGSIMIDINSDKKADKGLKDVEVELHACDKPDTVLKKVKTNTNGAYIFEGLIPQCYIVTEIDPKGYTSVSDIDGENDNNITVILKDKDIQKRDFLDEPLLKVSGHARADMDFDGDIEVESSKDINLKDVEITLYKGDTKVQTTKTDELGFYEFEDVTPGLYTIKESDPKGYDSLRDIDGENDNTIAVTLVEADITNRDFDDQKTLLIAGTIEVDIDGDKIVDEPLKDTQLLLCLEGEECSLESNIATTYTDSNGTYEFAGLKPGNYKIVEVDKPGYESLKDIDGHNDNTIAVYLDGTGDVVDQDFEDLAIAPHFIVIQKSVLKKEVHIGEFVPYNITVENVDESFTYAAVKIKDTLPGGFKYEKGSAKLIRDGVKSKLDASGISTIEFGAFALKPKEKVTLSYLLKVGVSVAQGKHINKAVAVQNEEEVSNISTASVKVVADPFIDNAVVVGKVFADTNENGIQDAGERGIPGVRLATVTGMLIETDGYGRYHIADVESGGFGGRGKNFIIKVDAATLPEKAEFTTENPRVYRITAGQLNVIDFGIKLPKQERVQKMKEVTKVVKKKEMVEVSKEVKIGSIFFDSDQDCIRPDQVKELKKIAEKIKEYGHGAIKIEGNTDARAPMWYNKKLAYKRARSVYIELQRLLGDSLTEKVDVVYDNCEREVTFNPLYDWWGKPNAPKTKKECTRFGILQKDCHRLLDKKEGGAL